MATHAFENAAFTPRGAFAREGKVLPGQVNGTLYALMSSGAVLKIRGDAFTIADPTLRSNRLSQSRKQLPVLTIGEGYGKSEGVVVAVHAPDDKGTDAEPGWVAKGMDLSDVYSRQHDTREPDLVLAASLSSGPQERAGDSLAGGREAGDTARSSSAEGAIAASPSGHIKPMGLA